MKNEKITAFAALAARSLTAGTMQSITFHSPSGGDCLKCKGTVKKIGGGYVVQFETSMTEGRVAQENVPADGMEEAVETYFDTYRKADLTDKNGTASVMISKKGAVTFLKKGKIGDTSSAPVQTESGNDRDKNRLLTGEEEFLKALGVSDEKGRIHDKKQSKFRQICRFSEYIVEAEKKLNREGTLYVCDLCCGKSYLSFAAYHVLTAVCGRDVKMTCVDLKQSVMDFCGDAAKAAHMDGMEFLCMNIDDFVPERTPDLVISLHACDIATDIVLGFASRYRADVILSTPCCHHRLNSDMDCPTLDFIADRSILKQKLATAATDALRLLKLEAEGYKTDATELIDPEDTPKNVMLRGVKRKNFRFDSDEARQKREKYNTAYRFFYGKDPDEKLFTCFEG
ncbi:MAG: methyltransferase [Clostridia bacterium]|nr:methyltransferase [Clostridia bacterium]